ncbi:MAG: hypothetical protein R6U04_04190 [Bacteroidales bacterium]
MKMKSNKNKYYALMIFLLTFLVLLPQMEAYSQNIKSKKEVQQHEEQLMMQLDDNKGYEFNNEGDNTIDVPNNFEWSRSFIEQERNKFGLNDNENYIQLYINGNNNISTAEQSNGKGNIIDLGIDGNGNSGYYRQQGHENYIYDRIDGYNLSHTIEQYGNGLGIYNEGMQNLPLTINQKGEGVKMKITNSP